MPLCLGGPRGAPGGSPGAWFIWNVLFWDPWGSVVASVKPSWGSLGVLLGSPGPWFTWTMALCWGSRDSMGRVEWSGGWGGAGETMGPPLGPKLGPSWPPGRLPAAYAILFDCQESNLRCWLEFQAAARQMAYQGGRKNTKQQLRCQRAGAQYKEAHRTKSDTREITNKLFCRCAKDPTMMKLGRDLVHISCQHN